MRFRGSVIPAEALVLHFARDGQCHPEQGVFSDKITNFRRA